MKIGYDGKRAFQNKTGLGNYSRSLVTILANYYPKNKYTLFAPKKTGLFNINEFKNINAITPLNFLGKTFKGWWRRIGIVKQIATTKIDIYHGISNELPRNIKKSKVKTVVTIHDIIFERYPETYNFDERFVHRWKVKQACKIADAVIAISEQTKADLINYYKIDEKKIFVAYQSCNPIFQHKISTEIKNTVKRRYNLPDKYFLFVSSIAPRKNLISICKALVLLKDKMTVPLVVIGNGKKEKEEAKQFLHANGIADSIIFLNEMPVANEDAFTSAIDFPAIYQQALALVYPSIFEGFGLPLLEALWSGLPVICSNTSSLPEVAAEAALYFSPLDVDTLATHLLNIATNPELVIQLREKGYIQAQNFTPEKYADNIINIYLKVYE